MGVDIMLVSDVAEELGVSEERVRKFCQHGRMGKKYGVQWIITRAELETFKKTWPGKPGRPPKK
jgi:hypothetical protein